MGRLYILHDGQVISSLTAVSGAFDLAIVGAGIIGLACARAAALKGLRVIVIDRDVQSNGASVRNFGFVTATGQERGTAWTRARRTCAIWEEVAQQADISILRRGLWMTTRRPEALPVLEAFLKTEMGEGCTILSRAAAHAFCGEIVNQQVQAVLRSSVDLRVESREAIPKIAAWLAARLGVVFLRRTTVLSAVPPRIETSRGVVNAGAVVVCPGDDMVSLYPDRQRLGRIDRIRDWRGSGDRSFWRECKLMAIRDRFDLVILDWAGTTVDFGCHAPVIALREAFALRGVAISDAQARRDMGKPKADHVRALLRDPAVGKAWSAACGHAAGDGDVQELMTQLAPLMRDQAARAARLIDGARSAVEALHAEGIKVGSSTGYTREMMAPVLHEAAAQGYVPDHLVCSGETPAGRPTPLMIYKACAELGVWPLSRVVKVDDTEVGVAEGRAAGCFTVGITASGNGVGMSQQALAALPAADRAARIAAAEKSLLAAGADVTIDTIAGLLSALG